MAEGRAVLAAEVDDLQVAVVPPVAGEHRLQIVFGAFHVRPVRQAPSEGESVDVGVDGERRHAEGLRHHDTGRLVTDAGQRLEERPIGQHLSAGVDDLVGCQPEVLGLGRGQPDLANDGEDLVGVE